MPEEIPLSLLPLPAQAPGAAGNAELEKVAAAYLALDPDGRRTAAALRRSIDMLLDGRHTGRYRWDQLHKTEKTHCGTLVEINLQREFGFDGGEVLDYSIAGTEVDCKYSQTMWGWMIPPEAVGRLCLVVWASDRKARWCAGLVRADEAVLNTGANRDAKRTLTEEGRAAVRPLFWDAPLPENALLRLPQPDVDAIFAPQHGTKRIDELFRRAQGVLVSRTVVETVAQQDDSMKRLRANGGSRTSLRPEGIVILGQYGSHQDIARRLGLPVPGPGESVSVRLARASARHGAAPRVHIDGADWVVAGPDDPPELAPLLPKI